MKNSDHSFFTNTDSSLKGVNDSELYIRNYKAENFPSGISVLIVQAETEI